MAEEPVRRYLCHTINQHGRPEEVEVKVEVGPFKVTCEHVDGVNDLVFVVTGPVATDDVLKAAKALAEALYAASLPPVLSPAVQAAVARVVSFGTTPSVDQKDLWAVLDQSVDTLDLLEKDLNALHGIGITLIGQLVQRTPTGLNKLGISKAGIKRIRRRLNQKSNYKLYFGTPRALRWLPSDLRKHGVDRLTPEQERDNLLADLNRKVSELNFSPRTEGCLRDANIVYVGQLVQRAVESLLRVKNFGRKSLKEVKEVLSELGLRLGMNAVEIFGWQSPAK